MSGKKCVCVCWCVCMLSEGKLYISAEVLQTPNEEESSVCLLLTVTAAHKHTEDKAASICSSGTTVACTYKHTPVHAHMLQNRSYTLTASSTHTLQHTQQLYKHSL
ncbi:hypothetical protein GOODEAATRI_004315 [Goodea atripinnis]|uniref:Uncharacterized protein n=1 Tax=Goodea atripinnis TaxID=208336 RepID=A0ABV0MR36_9TELE